MLTRCKNSERYDKYYKHWGFLHCLAAVGPISGHFIKLYCPDSWVNKYSRNFFALRVNKKSANRWRQIERVTKPSVTAASWVDRNSGLFLPCICGPKYILVLGRHCISQRHFAIGVLTTWSLQCEYICDKSWNWHLQLRGYKVLGEVYEPRFL